MSAISLNKRTGALVIAVLMAALATLVLLSYVRGLEREALAQSDPVSVYVANEVIPIGTTVEEAESRRLLTQEMLPRRAVVEGAVSDLSVLRDKVATAEILKGEQVLSQRFGDLERHRMLLDIPEGRQAISVAVGPPPGVGGYVTVGDRVSIIASVGTSQGQVTRYAVQDIEVLAVAARSQQAEDGDGTAGDILLTLALTPDEAEKVAYAVLHGQVYFTLVPQEQGPQPTGGRTADNLFS